MRTRSIPYMPDRRHSTLVLRVKHIAAAAAIPVVAVLSACLIGALILIVSGGDPIAAYVALLEGAFAGLSAFSRTLEKSIPLIFNGLAVALAFKAGLFNIGAQGQFLLGALVAAAVGYGFQGLPAVIHVPLAMIAGALAGGCYAVIKGALKAYTGAHEVITGIMLNYVAINLTDYFAAGPLRDVSGGNIVARTPLIQDTAIIPTIGGLPLGFAMALLVALGVWAVLSHTTLGFEVRTVGSNHHAARYAGIKVRRTFLLTMLISGMLAGLGGAIETQGVIHRFQPGFNVGLGFDGITIALLARVHPLGVIPAAMLVGVMRSGASQMQFSAGVSPEIIDVIQALILFFIAADTLVHWMIRSRGVDAERMVLTTGWGKIG